MTAAGGAPGGSGHAGDAGGATIAAGAVNGGTSGVGGASGAGTTASAGVGGISCAPSEGAVEICDGIDNDCSGVADDGNACSAGCTGDVNAGRSYMYCTTPVFPSAAADACAAENMRLVRVNDSAENAYLVQRITADAWLGGSDAVFEGYWFWPDGELFWIGNQFGTSNGAYANFALGEPNNLSGHPDPEEDCAILRADGLWNDVPCGLTAHSFVCELY